MSSLVIGWTKFVYGPTYRHWLRDRQTSAKQYTPNTIIKQNVGGSTQVLAHAWNNAQTTEVFLHQLKLKSHQITFTD